MNNIGRRKGKRKALQVPGDVVEVSGSGPFNIKIEKTRIGGELCTVKSQKKIKKGPVWIIIAPLKSDGEVGHRSSVTLSTLQEINSQEVVATFESEEGPFKRVDMVLDNRGRAKNLQVGESYSFSLKTPEMFFQAYETRSIPAGKHGRSEPNSIGERRIQVFTELLDAQKNDLILDCATGIKGYLKAASAEGSSLVCLNYSSSMLDRTKTWLEDDYAFFVRYNADRGFPFRDQLFDTVIVDAVLEYVKDPLLFLKRCSALIKPSGKLLILEPVSSNEFPEFYPQDLWELALWRPGVDKNFSIQAFGDLLREIGFDLIERKNLDFVYPVFSEVGFSQSAASFKKIFIP